MKRYFEKEGLGDRVRVLEDSTATVDLAAQAIGCCQGQIVKTLCFLVDDSPVVIVSAGDVKIDNRKYRTTFGQKAKMIPSEEVEKYTGHRPGGVCAFALKAGVSVYLDISLKRFAVMYSGAGDRHSIVELSGDELAHHTAFKDWVDVCTRK